MPVDPNGIGLSGEGIGRSRDIFNEKGNPVDYFDGNFIQTLSRWNKTITKNGIIKIPDFDVTCRSQQVLRIECADDLCGGHAAGQHPFTIHKHCDLPNGSTDRGQRRRTGHHR